MWCSRCKIQPQKCAHYLSALLFPLPSLPPPPPFIFPLFTAFLPPSLPSPFMKGTVSRDFRLLVFFVNQFPLSTWVYHYGHFKFFLKLAEIFTAQGAPPVSWHRRQMGKTFKLKNFNNIVRTPLGSKVNIYIHFCLQVHFKMYAAW